MNRVLTAGNSVTVAVTDVVPKRVDGVVQPSGQSEPASFR